MAHVLPKKPRSKLRILRTSDPQSMFHHNSTAKEVLEKLGRPRSLISSSSKTDKSREVGVYSRVLYLTSGVFCPAATESCLKLCLGHTAGRMTMSQAANARDRRTALYLEDQDHFLELLRCDLQRLRDDARAVGMTAAMRLNGCSDVPWERLHGELFEEFFDIRFYDYTKIAARYRAYLEGRAGTRPFPANYHLTFSQGEDNGKDAAAFLAAGGNVAVVFWPVTPSTWNGYEVIDADTHDARFLDPKGCIVGLSAKGITAQEDLTGFVVRTDAFVQRKWLVAADAA